MNTTLEPSETWKVAPTRRARFRRSAAVTTPNSGGRTKRAARIGAAATTLALALTLSPVHAQTASAFNPGDCSNQGSLYDVDTIAFNGGPVDLGGGVVCWTNGRGKVQVLGTMYLDAGYREPSGARFKGCVRIVLRFSTTTGAVITSANTSKDLCDAEGNDWFSTSYDFNKTVTASNLNKVSVYAYKKSSATNNEWALVQGVHAYYG